MTAHSISSGHTARAGASGARRSRIVALLAFTAFAVALALILVWDGFAPGRSPERVEPPRPPAQDIRPAEPPAALPPPPETPSRLARRPAPVPLERPDDPPAAEPDPFADVEILSITELAAISQAR